MLDKVKIKIYSICKMKQKEGLIMDRHLRTKRGYDLYEVASALQKAIRRNETAIAGYFALELLESGYHNYVWKKLLTISAEDCHGVITQEFDEFVPKKR